MFRLITALSAFLALFALTSLPAKAVNVTVAGVTYDVTLSAPGITYNSIESTLTANPWFGNSSLASQIATGFLTATGGDFGISAFVDVALFTHTDTDNSNPNSSALSLAISEVGGVSLNVGAKSTPNLTNEAFAIGTIVPVPEINGATLVQALFVLFALSFLLKARRARRVA